MLNGQPINGMEDGKMYWSNWSGMNDIANVVQIRESNPVLRFSQVDRLVTRLLMTPNGGFRGRISVVPSTCPFLATKIYI